MAACELCGMNRCPRRAASAVTLASLCQSSRALHVFGITACVGDGCKAQVFGAAQQLANGHSPTCPPQGGFVHYQALSLVSRISSPGHQPGVLGGQLQCLPEGSPHLLHPTHILPTLQTSLQQAHPLNFLPDRGNAINRDSPSDEPPPRPERNAGATADQGLSQSNRSATSCKRGQAGCSMKKGTLLL